MFFISNAVLAERIAGIAQLLTDAQDYLVENLDVVDEKVDTLNDKVAIQNGRITVIEEAKLVGETERSTLRQVASADRQHNHDVERTQWTRWQKVLGLVVAACALISAAGGLSQLVHL